MNDTVPAWKADDGYLRRRIELVGVVAVLEQLEQGSATAELHFANLFRDRWEKGDHALAVAYLEVAFAVAHDPDRTRRIAQES